MIYPITPVPKPRQTRADKWRQRPSVMRYRAFADECRLRGVAISEGGDWIIFHMPMPQSWSKKDRKAMRGQPHQQRPDKDNLEKALLDAVFPEDCRVWDSRITKVWADEGAIEIKPINWKIGNAVNAQC